MEEIKRLSGKEKEAVKRCKYASQLLKENNIPHAIKKEEIGHINLLFMGKAVMSFWARTGKFIFLITPKGPIITQTDRGIKSCIESYNQFVKLEN